MERMNWSGRLDPVDTYGFEEDSETDYQKPSSFFEDDILSESDNDLDIDASHILGEEMSSDEDNSNDEKWSIDEKEDDKSNYFEFDGDQTERDSVGGDSSRHRIDPSAHEPSRYDDRYIIKPDPYDQDDRPDSFNEQKKKDPYDEESIGSYNESSIGSYSREDKDEYDDDDDNDNDNDDDAHDIENPSVSYRTFGFDQKNNDEFSSVSVDKDKSFGDVPSRTESRGESGIEVEEIVEFDSVSKKVQEGLKRDDFDDEPKEESKATVQTSRERRIITFLSVFVCCLVTLLIIAIAVGIGLGLSKSKKSQPTPTSLPIFPSSKAPTFSPSGAPTLRVATLAPSSKPSVMPTRTPTNSPTDTDPQPQSYSTIEPTNSPVMEPAIPSTNSPVNEPSPIALPPDSPDTTKPSTLLPTTPSAPSPDSQNTELLQFLVSNSSDEGEAVTRTGTSQNKAYEWLLTNAFLAIYSDEQILTRYSLATFFYATNGPTTWDSSIRDDGWLTDAPECEWGSTANNQCTKGVYTSLTLDFVAISGTIPQELGLLTGLERFSVRGSVETADILSGTIPDVFGNLSNMQTIRLNDNDLTGVIPSSFGSMKNCLVLILSGNSLIGKIPAELANTQARTLNFSNNQLSGRIPNELFSLTELQIVNLQNNYLSGTIPSEIGTVTSISNINFSNNQLGGSIPTEIGNLVEIRSAINFSSNNLSGGIPSEIGLLNKMKNFEVQNNFLAGFIPEQLSGLTNIELFRIDDNAGIVGSMPDLVCNTFGMKAISYSDCGLESFTCNCCTYCCKGGVCECNIADADICGEDLTGARAPFL